MIDPEVVKARPQEHILFQTGDADAPPAILDSNGDVVLALCRRCGRGEVDLIDQPCDRLMHHCPLCRRRWYNDLDKPHRMVCPSCGAGREEQLRAFNQRLAKGEIKWQGKWER